MTPNKENNNNNKLRQLTHQLSMLEHEKRAIFACDSFETNHTYYIKPCMKPNNKAFENN